MSRKVIIMGAAGKDFHVFNTVYRDRTDSRVVAFTATQIPGIDGRRYPAALAGSAYPEGIPIEAEDSLEDLIRTEDIDDVVFAYSDVTYDYVDRCRRRVTAGGASFHTSPTKEVMVASSKPVIVSSVSSSVS